MWEGLRISSQDIVRMQYLFWRWVVDSRFGAHQRSIITLLNRWFVFTSDTYPSKDSVWPSKYLCTKSFDTYSFDLLGPHNRAEALSNVVMHVEGDCSQRSISNMRPNPVNCSGYKWVTNVSKKSRWSRWPILQLLFQLAWTTFKYCTHWLLLGWSTLIWE